MELLIIHVQAELLLLVISCLKLFVQEQAAQLVLQLIILLPYTIIGVILGMEMF